MGRILPDFPSAGRPGSRLHWQVSLDPTWLFLSLIPGGIGLVLFKYGRKQQRLPQTVAGLIFLVYPYFATTVPSLVGIGVAIATALWVAIRLGW